MGQGIKPVDISTDKKNELLSQVTLPIPGEEIRIPLEEFYGYFIPVYLNNDTLIDFIYTGPSGGESSLTIIYLNSGTELKPTKSAMGAITRIQKSLPDAPTILYFTSFACCDDPLNYFQIWTLRNNQITETEKYYFLNETVLPETLNFEFIFRIQNSPYYLRATPEIINDDFHYHYRKGNIIAEFNEGDIGKVLASKTDNSDKTWLFVAMEKPGLKGFHSYDKNRDERWLGWMSGRFVEKIN